MLFVAQVLDLIDISFLIPHVTAVTLAALLSLSLLPATSSSTLLSDKGARKGGETERRDARS